VNERWMSLSLELAATSHAHPNPRVGTVVLDSNGELVGTGRHEGPGTPHAETLALAEAGSRSRGGTIYVTLEPCAHHGRTPPCVDAILAAEVSKVIVACVDPDERVAGRGIEQLREAGVDVVVGVLEEEARQLDPGYFHHRETGLPWVTLKAAATLDGQVAAADGTSKWITSEATRQDAHTLRASADAVMVGAGTVRIDDPLLTVRTPGYEGPQPVPVIIGGTSPLPSDARIWSRDPVVLYPASSGELVDLRAGLSDLATRGFLDVLVEGGPTLAASLLSEGLVNRLVLYLAPSVAGGIGRGIFNDVFRTLADVHPARIVSVDQVGGAIKIAALLEED